MTQPEDQHQPASEEPQADPTLAFSSSASDPASELPAFPVTVPPLSPDLAPPTAPTWSAPEPAAEPTEFATYRPEDPVASSAPASPASPEPEPASPWDAPAATDAVTDAWTAPASSPDAVTDAWTAPAEHAAPNAWDIPAEPAAPIVWAASEEPAAGEPMSPPAAANPVEPVYQPPQDPYATSAIPAPELGEPASPYTAPTYYPTQPVPAPQPVYTPGSAPVPPPPTAPISAAPYPYPGHPGYPVPPKKKSKALVITAVVLGLVLTLCAVGGIGAYFLLRDTEGTGQTTAQKAADDFLTAIYKDGDVNAAEKLVCGEARDKKALTAKINEIKDQKAKLKSPSYSWDTPKIADETDKGADTTVTVKLATSDEKVAEQTLKLTLVKRDGWFVCEVQEQK